MGYAKNLTSMEEILALKESKNYLAVEGIIEDVKEKVTKTGESYVCGTLCCRDLKLPFKKWSENLQSITLPQSKVVQLFGNVQYYNNEIQFVVNSFGESKTDPILGATSSILYRYTILDRFSGCLFCCCFCIINYARNFCRIHGIGCNCQPYDS